MYISRMSQIHMVKINPSLKNESSIKVKITGDGTKVSRSMHILVLAFTILDGNENPNSPTGNHVIAMFNTQEKYEYLSGAVKDISNEIQSTAIANICSAWFLDS